MKAAKPKKPKLTQVKDVSNVDRQSCSFCEESIFRVKFLWRSQRSKGVAICGDCAMGIAEITMQAMQPTEDME